MHCYKHGTKISRKKENLKEKEEMLAGNLYYNPSTQSSYVTTPKLYRIMLKVIFLLKFFPKWRGIMQLVFY